MAKKSSSKICIIGLGRFGTLVASILSKHSPVFIYHYKDNPEIKKRARLAGGKLIPFDEISKCDVIILTVPIIKTEQMIKDLARVVKPGALVIDTCSVKVLPCRWLKKHLPKNINILGSHPMFGPTTTKFNLAKQTWKIDDKQVVLCPLRLSKNKLKAIELFLKKLKLEVIITTPEDHDKQNAKTLSLVHFLGRALTISDIKEQKIFTPGYTDLLKIIPHTSSDNWQLFFDMHNFNPYAAEIRKKFLNACEKLEEKIIKDASDDNFDFNRKMIDKIDGEIFKLLKERNKHTKQIGKIKKQRGLPIVDKNREAKIIKDKIKKSGLKPELVKKLYKLLFEESYKSQK